MRQILLHIPLLVLALLGEESGRGHAQAPRPADLSTAHIASRHYLYAQIDSDSALWYARLAESASVTQPHASAYAKLLQAEIAGRLLDRPTDMEAHGQSALSTLSQARESRYKHELASWAHRLIGTACALQGKTPDALRQLDSALLMARLAESAGMTGWTHQAIGFTHAKTGNYWDAFIHLQASLDAGRSTSDTLLTALSLTFMGRLFHHAGHPREAIAYYQAYVALPPPPITVLWPHLEDLGQAYLELGQPDSAEYYRERQLELLYSATRDPSVREIATARLSLYFPYAIQLRRGRPDTVLRDLAPALADTGRSGSALDRMHLLALLAEAADAMGMPQATRRYAADLFRLAEASRNLHFKGIAAHWLADAYEKTGMADSAFHYYRIQVAVRDSQEASSFAVRAAHLAYSREAEANLLALRRINREQARSRNMLAAGVVVLFIAGAAVYRNAVLRNRNQKLLHDQARAALEKKAAGLEMQALRAQMNPHFIFNCLSAIDNLIQQGRNDQATRYLTRFARLIRLVLESSRKNTISFEKDMDAMRLYLEMEQFRCNGSFDFAIEVDDALGGADVQVPPLIIQPFIENAIHHGLLNKPSGERRLVIRAWIDGPALTYEITDNGIGRTRADALRQLNKPHHESMGIGITRERLKLHNPGNAEDTVEIIDLDESGGSTGTQALVRIPLDSLSTS